MQRDFLERGIPILESVWPFSRDILILFEACSLTIAKLLVVPWTRLLGFGVWLPLKASEFCKVLSSISCALLIFFHSKTLIYIGHTSGVVAIHFIDRFLASGSVDGIVRVWNLQTGSSFTLVGHASWVNKVQILSCKTQLLSCSDDGKTVRSLIMSFT